MAKMDRVYGNIVNKKWSVYGDCEIIDANSWNYATLYLESGVYFNNEIGFFDSLKGTNSIKIDGETVFSREIPPYGGYSGSKGETDTAASGLTDIPRKTVDYNVTLTFTFTEPSGTNKGTSTKTAVVTIPALYSWEVTYDTTFEATNMPEPSRQFFGKSFTVSPLIPIREGYTFTGWNDFDGVIYQPGDVIEKKIRGLYANWERNPYTLKFNANGGTLSQDPITINAGDTLDLTEIKPTRSGYALLGWATSPLAETPQYTTSITPTSSVTLYAVWKLGWIPSKITSIQSLRTDESFTEDSGGENAKISWTTTAGTWLDEAVTQEAKVEIRYDTALKYTKTNAASPLKIPKASDYFDTSKQYTVTLTITDKHPTDGSILGTVTKRDYISAAQFTMDFNADGTAICFFGEAPDNEEGLFIKNMSGVVTNIIDMIYPIGSIYMSAVDTSPAVFLGGAWEQIKDTFLLSAGDSYSAGDSGGEANHALTVDEMPSHNHEFNLTKRKLSASDDSGTYRVTDSTTRTELTATAIANKGGGTSHNNMPPYLTVYMWKRIA